MLCGDNHGITPHTPVHLPPLIIKSSSTTISYSLVVSLFEIFTPIEPRLRSKLDWDGLVLVLGLDSLRGGNNTKSWLKHFVDCGYSVELKLTSEWLIDRWGGGGCDGSLGGGSLPVLWPNIDLTLWTGWDCRGLGLFVCPTCHKLLINIDNINCISCIPDLQSRGWLEDPSVSGSGCHLQVPCVWCGWNSKVHWSSWNDDRDS